MLVGTADTAVIPQFGFGIRAARDRVAIFRQAASLQPSLRLKKQFLAGIGAAPAERNLAPMYRDLEVPSLDLAQRLGGPADSFLDLPCRKRIAAELEVPAHPEVEREGPRHQIAIKPELFRQRVCRGNRRRVAFDLHIERGGVETPQTRCVVLNPRATGDIRPDIGLCGPSQQGCRQPQRSKKGHFVDFAGYRARGEFRV